MKKDKSSFYIDSIITSIIIEDPKLIKTAGIDSYINSAISSIKSYFSSKLNSESSTEDILKFLAPGAIYAIFSAMGIPWIGTLFGLATRYFNINIPEILKSIYYKIVPIVTNRQGSESDVDNIISSSMNSSYKKLNENEAQVVDKQLSSQSSLKQIYDAKIVKLALIDFEKRKNAGVLRSATSSMLQPKIFNAVKSILGWTVKIILASAGIMVVSDVISHVTGKEDEESPKQSKFKLNQSYDKSKFSSANRIQEYMNTPEGISNMILDFAKEVYEGLDDKDNLIKNTPGFKAVLETISWYNRKTAGDSIVFIPETFSSKKNIVDNFIHQI